MHQRWTLSSLTLPRWCMSYIKATDLWSRNHLKVFVEWIMSPLPDGFNDSVCLFFRWPMISSTSRQCPGKEGDRSAVLCKDSDDCSVWSVRLNYEECFSIYSWHNGSRQFIFQWLVWRCNFFWQEMRLVANRRLNLIGIMRYLLCIIHKKLDNVPLRLQVFWEG